jgi:hypothetical protein
MSNGKRLMNFRLTNKEAEILVAYCERTGRTQTDVLREFIRQLACKDVSRQAPAKAAAPKRPARRQAWSETVDLSMLGAQVQELDRQLRLVRLRLDTLVSSTGNTNNRLTTIEQGSHGLTGEMARGFGQIQQQLTKHTRQLTVV